MDLAKSTSKERLQVKEVEQGDFFFFIYAIGRCKWIHVGNISLYGSFFPSRVSKGPVGKTKHDG